MLQAASKYFDSFNDFLEELLRLARQTTKEFVRIADEPNTLCIGYVFEEPEFVWVKYRLRARKNSEAPSIARKECKNITDKMEVDFLTALFVLVEQERVFKDMGL